MLIGVAEVTVKELSGGSTFLWGGLGGAAGYLLTIVLPRVNEMVEGKRPLPDRLQVVGLLVLAAVHFALGGVAAMQIGNATAVKHAISYGLGWPTALRGAGGLTGIPGAAKRKKAKKAAPPAGT